METILDLIAYFVASALAIWIVGKLGLLTVRTFGSTLVASFAIAFVTALVSWLFAHFGIPVGGFFGGLLALVVTTVVLLVSNRFAPGIEVYGFPGAVIAALAIGAVDLLFAIVLSLVTQI